MQLSRYVSAFLVGLLITSIIFSVSLLSTNITLSGQSMSSQTNIDTTAEYSNGSIPSPPTGVWIWYTWINTSETQIISYALFSDTYNSPIMSFLGQHFQIENNTDVFVGTTLALIEIYNDTNGDSIPQANFTSGESEIIYHLGVNSSLNYQITPIQKIMKGEIAHYMWGFKHEIIDGFLLYPEQYMGHIAAAFVTIDYLSFMYDFYVVQNASYLKTSFEIGNITDIQPYDDPSPSLEGLSLSLLYSTVTSSAKSYSAYVNDEPYDSTTAPNPATTTNSSQIAVEMIKAYEFIFGESYNLTRSETIETYGAESEAAATISVHPDVIYGLDWAFSWFENNLNLSEMFPAASGLGGQVDLNCSVSTLLYRNCYPVWDGLPILHDPTYVAYLFSNTIILEFSTVILFPMFIVATLFILVVSRIRKHQPF
ncbi:MAG: hypothetical protein JSV05_02305 [Candidatus Bathyarchaeota archaeon]|nr:MAG: hypothetical protein JSV05_02305 [Candidatus Bathyarchaeota archaeon]